MPVDGQPSASVFCGCIEQLLICTQKVTALEHVWLCRFAVNQLHAVG